MRSAEELIRAADVAMYRAKMAGKAGVACASPWDLGIDSIWP
jgi:PleD family two-component response regulator